MSLEQGIVHLYVRSKAEVPGGCQPKHPPGPAAPPSHLTGFRGSYHKAKSCPCSVPPVSFTSPPSGLAFSQIGLINLCLSAITCKISRVYFYLYMYSLHHLAPKQYITQKPFLQHLRCKSNLVITMEISKCRFLLSLINDLLPCKNLQTKTILGPYFH